jgi:hypothetical protein
MSVHRSFTDLPDEAPSPKADSEDTIEREPTRLRTATEKGALWHEYDFLVHQFVAHLRRVHPANKDIMMEIGNFGKVLVKAAVPLAKLEYQLYYTHSKTNLCNDIFTSGILS